jgi:hypothetical protein
MWNVVIAQVRFEQQYFLMMSIEWLDPRIRDVGDVELVIVLLSVVIWTCGRSEAKEQGRRLLT